MCFLFVGIRCNGYPSVLQKDVLLDEFYEKKDDPNGKDSDKWFSYTKETPLEMRFDIVK